MNTPILMLGAGNMGGAMIEGWLGAQTFAAADLMIMDPRPGPAAQKAQSLGARLNPQNAELAEARTVILSVKPQVWRDAAASYSSWLATEAVIISVVAGVASSDLAKAFAGRIVGRVIPTTAVAINQGAASLYAEDPAARARAHELFDPLGLVVDLSDEHQMHAATAVSGSGPAYLYAFVESLEAAAVAAGLGSADASRLARATIVGAGALLAQSGEEPAELRRRVTSPGGTTEAALNVLLGEHGLPPLMREALARAMRRSKELGA